VPSERGDGDPDGHERGDNGQGGDELDYRFSLANERTFLAWVRTSLALLAGGIALEEIATSFLGDDTRTALAAAAVALSLLLVTASWRRWGQVQSAMEEGRPLPHPWAIPLLATGVAVLAGVLGLALVFG
jgi:putative membrane protein